MRQTERERDRETERQGDRETDRQTAREGNPVAREGHPVPCDDFSHYLFCPSMWRIIDSIVLHSTPIDPSKRLGLIASNFENLFTLACAFHAYHNIKQVRDNPPSSLHFTKNIRLFLRPSFLLPISWACSTLVISWMRLPSTVQTSRSQTTERAYIVYSVCHECLR